jgi:hypothetical protein
MPWTTPTKRDAGSAILASDQNIWVDDLLMGNPVFTNEAARDAAITAPSEGQMVYLTTSTVVTATGAQTQVPTGIATIYNGSAWVCVTEVGASSTTSGTTTSTSYVTTLTGDGTAISATLATGTSALVSIYGNTQNSNAGVLVYVSVGVTGAGTVAAADGNGAYMNHNANYWTPVTRTFVMTGLTAGTNTFTLSYRTGNNTATFSPRSLVVKGIA